MHIKIYYISGTGNTKRAVELIRLQLNSMNHKCSIVDWVHNDFNNWNDADAFGFAAPVHAFREPTPFRKKVKNLPKSVDKQIPVFIIASCAGAAGNIFYRTAKLLKKKGVRIIATYTYYAMDNVLMWAKSFEKSKNKLDPDRNRKVLEFAKTLSGVIEKNKPIKIKRNLGGSIIAVITKDWNLRIMVSNNIFVDENLCIQCGTCAERCISQCINLDPYPVINMKKCVVCLACINLCPKDALNSKKTIGKLRFKGPGKLEIQPI